MAAEATNGGAVLPGCLDKEELDSVRALFDMKPSEIYLACASRAPMALRTLDVAIEAAAKKKKPWTISDGCDERVRYLFAQLINSTPDDVALCPSTSFALTTAARAVALHMQDGDVGLILEDQMSSNTYPWQLLQRTRGLALEAIPCPMDGDWTKAVLLRLHSLEEQGRRVAVVAVPVYLWTDCSGPLDIASISAVCKDATRRVKTMLVIDGTQSVGAVPFNVQTTPVDFLAASVHKWLFGAYGLSCLYVSPEWWADLRLEPLVEDEHIRAHMANGDDEVAFDLSLPGYPTALKAGARRLDGGGRPNPIIQPTAADGLELVLQWRPEKIASALAPLTQRIRQRCQSKLALWVPPHHGPHFVGIGPGPKDNCRDSDAVALWCQKAAAFLKQRSVFVSARLKVIRVAPHLYTSVNDVDRFIEVLAAFVREYRKDGTTAARL